MEPWVWWLLATLVLAGAEVLSGASLVFGMVAFGTAGAALAAAAGAAVGLQFAVFAVVSVATLVGVRPVARRHLRQPAVTRTGVEALVGAEAVVLEEVGAHGGRVKLAGEVWSARAFDGGVHAVGQTVQVIQIEGATALVA